MSTKIFPFLYLLVTFSHLQINPVFSCRPIKPFIYFVAPARSGILSMYLKVAFEKLINRFFSHKDSLLLVFFLKETQFF